ncbi:conjugative relaxase-like TrwC/TraI family protein [Kribbella steppae]|uniref:Conjugative relaxase-like TrwC/TraI family protein n=1 Tax=Kribbella steppae TaxID=2512223 RepID=A0A4R2HPD6_9ACTN|nr:MobF family relaxase [Kribbella steppae]TCO33022.1 conjugative relaxase-like TrwC/TraI family protein [Kribbella steppae]
MSVHAGHSADYLTGAVAAGRENYYTGATAAGEPPGRWYGRGAAALGLQGEVDAQDMNALYERYIDPRDSRFRDPALWDEAENLGHTGRAYKTEAELYASALANEPGADAERREQLRGEAGRKAQKNVAFHDATFSVQKSVTVLHTAFEAQEVRALRAVQQARSALDEARDSGAGAATVHRLEQAVHRTETEAATWTQHRKAVEAAIWAGNNAALEYLADKSGYVRIGHHGGASGRYADAHDWTVASFFQHDSRDHDPQLHIHNAILNRVQGADGKWRTLDGQGLYKYKSAAGAVGERVMEQHLTRSLGVEFKLRPDGEAREIVGVDQSVMDLFSSRRVAITKKTATLVAQFRQRFGREPNALELERMQERATKATRRAKSHDGETAEARLDRWDQELRAEVAGGLATVADQVLARRQRQQDPTRFDEDEVLDIALASVQDKQAEWREADLTRAISLALPDALGELGPEEITEQLERLTRKGLDRAVQLGTAKPGADQLPAELRLANGQSSYEAPGRATYATAGHLNAERKLARAGYERGAPCMAEQQARAFVKDLAAMGLRLGDDQAAAVRGILCSGATTEVLIGPAGTGKSRVVGALAKAWADPVPWHGVPRRVVGLASSQIATEVLAADNVPALNVSRWLAAQQRLANGAYAAADRQWIVGEGDLVVLDESGMTSTQDLAAIRETCDRLGAKLLLVGDQRQLAAVGAGGGMDLVTSQALTHELTETRRFDNAWEGPASLRLRAGDESVLAEYHRRGRIIDGGNVERAEALAGDAWLSDRILGLHSMLLVDTNDQAARVSAQLRARLVSLGMVGDARTVRLGMQGTRAGAGDIIQARKNDRKLAGQSGNTRAVINRALYRIDEVLPDGGLRVTPLETGSTGEVPGETMILSAGYVAEHVSLGYASTVHAAQGLTVDTSYGVVTSSTSLNSLYVQASRGRSINAVYVVTQSAPRDAEPGETRRALHRSPRAVLTEIMDAAAEHRQRSATEARDASAAEAVRHRTPAELLADAIGMATATRAAQWLDRAAADGALTVKQRAKLAAEAGAATLTALLRRVELAGHDPEAVLSDAISRRDLGNARELSNVIHDRITKTTRLDPVGATYSERLPAVADPAWGDYLDRLALDADTAARDLAFDLAEEQPAWLVEQLGECPDDDADAAEAWIGRAAAVAGYRDLAAWDSDTNAIGPAPNAGQTEAYAAWRAAWDALGRHDDHRAEAEMTVGQLRVRVAAYQREQAWAPPYVGEELAATRQAADKARQQAALRDAEAETTSAHEARERLRAEADDARALAKAHDALVAELAEIDEARAEWLAHTAATRDAAARARSELKERGVQVVDRAETDHGTTSAEWLAAEREHDDWRVLGENDLTEVADARDRDTATAQPGDEFVEAELVHDQLTAAEEGGAVQVDEIPDAEVVDAHTDDTGLTDADDEATEQLEAQAPADLRTVASAEPRVLEADALRVPTADETAEAVRRAQRALIEVRQRDQADARRAAEEAARRDEELAHWHNDDHEQTQLDAEQPLELT